MSYSPIPAPLDLQLDPSMSDNISRPSQHKSTPSLSALDSSLQHQASPERLNSPHDAVRASKQSLHLQLTDEHE